MTQTKTNCDQFQTQYASLCMVYGTPFPYDSPRGAKDVPGEQSHLPPWHQYPEQIYHHYNWQSPPSPPAILNLNFIFSLLFSSIFFYFFMQNAYFNGIGAFIRIGREIQCLAYA